MLKLKQTNHNKSLESSLSTFLSYPTDNVRKLLWLFFFLPQKHCLTTHFVHNFHFNPNHQHFPSGVLLIAHTPISHIYIGPLGTSSKQQPEYPTTICESLWCTSALNSALSPHFTKRQTALQRPYGIWSLTVFLTSSLYCFPLCLFLSSHPGLLSGLWSHLLWWNYESNKIPVSLLPTYPNTYSHLYF